MEHRTDIRGLGLVIYELITGKQPFAGDYEQAVIYSIMSEPGNAHSPGVAMELDAGERTWYGN